MTAGVRHPVATRLSWDLFSCVLDLAADLSGCRPGVHEVDIDAPGMRLPWAAALRVNHIVHREIRGRVNCPVGARGCEGSVDFRSFEKLRHLALGRPHAGAGLHGRAHCGDAHGKRLEVSSDRLDLVSSPSWNLDKVSRPCLDSPGGARG